MFLVGCSNEQEEAETAKKNKSQENSSFQEQLENLMDENDFKYEEIIDLDIIDDYIYSVTVNFNGGLDLAIIKNNNGTLKWIAGSGDATILQYEDSRYVYLIKPDDPEVKQVNVFDVPVKSVTYYHQQTESYTREIKYWIAYTEKEPAPSVVEYIKN